MKNQNIGPFIYKVYLLLILIFVLNQLRFTSGNDQIFHTIREDGNSLGPFNVGNLRSVNNRDVEYTTEDYAPISYDNSNNNIKNTLTSELVEDISFDVQFSEEYVTTPSNNDYIVTNTQDSVTPSSNDYIVNNTQDSAQLTTERKFTQDYGKSTIQSFPKIKYDISSPESEPARTLTSSIITENPETSACHLSCKDDLSKMLFEVSPSSSFHSIGSTMSLQCSLPLPPTEHSPSFELLWLFQSTNPPSPECSLTPHLTIASCEQFGFIEHIRDALVLDEIIEDGEIQLSNRSDFDLTNVKLQEMKIMERLVIQNLNLDNSGEYLCQVQLTCCHMKEEHIMSKSLDIELIIYSSNYTVELVILGLILAVMVAGMSFMIYKESRHQTHAKKNAKDLSVEAGLGNSFSPGVPLLDGWKYLSGEQPTEEDDDDSFESEEESFAEHRDEAVITNMT